MIAILQPNIPHYREKFFSLILKEKQCDIFCYNTDKSISKQFENAIINTKPIGSFKKEPILIYNPIVLLQAKYDILILMLHIGHISTWVLLFTKFIHRKKIILWGQGISVKRYLDEEIKPDWKLKLMLRLSDGAWIYTEKETMQWKQIFNKKKLVALNNTLSFDSNNILHHDQIQDIKRKYNIIQPRILIFSARFENPYRRTDLLVDLIKKLDTNKYGFIIIGSGQLKPDFSGFKNVYDFGRLYDVKIKKDLFSISNIYFQPGWVGLSIVEAMSYSLPIFTFKRSYDIKQCVEYSYIIDKYNGFTFGDFDECVAVIESIKDEELRIMGVNAFEYVQNKLTVERMVENALSII